MDSARSFHVATQLLPPSTAILGPICAGFTVLISYMIYCVFHKWLHSQRPLMPKSPRCDYVLGPSVPPLFSWRDVSHTIQHCLLYYHLRCYSRKQEIYSSYYSSQQKQTDHSILPLRLNVYHHNCNDIIAKISLKLIANHVDTDIVAVLGCRWSQDLSSKSWYRSSLKNGPIFNVPHYLKQFA